MDFKTTADIKVPKRLIDQIIGQDEAVQKVLRAVRQRRHVLLVGPPGTGKSMIAKAVSELLPPAEPWDVLSEPNPLNEDRPRIRVVPTYPDKEYLARHPQYQPLYEGQEAFLEKPFPARALLLKDGLGRRLVQSQPPQQRKSVLPLFLTLVGLLLLKLLGVLAGDLQWFVLALALVGLFAYYFLWTTGKKDRPHLLIDRTGEVSVPFVDATAMRPSALLGDVKHDPFQSGSLATPAHKRLQPGAIHQAHGGILFMDEIGLLEWRWQQELLTALQDKKYPIYGKSEMSSGSVVRSDPVPCDFILIAAGSAEDLAKIHPALRSRLEGEGYIITMRDYMEDTPQNRALIARFVAQEIARDRRIPHFSKAAVQAIIEEARRRSPKPGTLTLRLRELGGLVRMAGDIALSKKKKVVGAAEVREAIKQSTPPEILNASKWGMPVKKTGWAIGRVNGVGVIGHYGMIIPVLATVSPGKGKVIATGRLGKIAKEAVENVSAVLKALLKERFYKQDIHIQFLHLTEGIEGDSASVAVALAVLSAALGIPVRQDAVITGSLSVRGEILPVGAVEAKRAAAEKEGLTFFSPANLKTLREAVKAMMKPSRQRAQLLRSITKIFSDGAS